MEPVLNLNNEVVKMRKDVKKVKVLIIRRLTRHIAKLKAKKGTEELVVKNQRRAQRLLEEIHAIKELKPDIVTKAALRKEINFDKVFKQPSSTAEDRAIARIATYPLMKHKIAALKDAIKAFKDARRNLPDEDSDNKAPPSQPLPVQKEVSKGESKLKEGKSVRKRKTEDAKQDESKAGGKRTLVEPDCPSEGPSDQSHLKALPSINKVEEKSEAVESVSETIKSVPEKRALVEEADHDSSDIEDSDKEDKEYFDDSTEERFHKQSSGFEDSESESEDDFFIGKVRQTKKKKSDKKCSEPTEKKDKSKRDVHGGPEPKTVKLQSVFCKSLSDIKQKSSYVRRDIHAAPAKNRIPVVPQANKLKKAMPSRGPAAKPSSKPRESLHPSWEASRRRKEQQSQITAFQGKKIIFDD